MKSLVVITALIALSTATKVKQCPGGDIKNLEESVTIGTCDKPPCKLKKNTKVPATFKFVAEEEYKDLKLVVTGDLSGIVVPFVGVDGASACPFIYEEDGTTKNECKFIKGKTYIYKNEIDILQIYPTVRVNVHWSITDPATGKHAICFEVPATIIN